MVGTVRSIEVVMEIGPSAIMLSVKFGLIGTDILPESRTNLTGRRQISLRCLDMRQVSRRQLPCPTTSDTQLDRLSNSRGKFEIVTRLSFRGFCLRLIPGDKVESLAEGLCPVGLLN